MFWEDCHGRLTSRDQCDATMTTVKKEKWREKVFPAGREVKGENVKNKENGKRKKQKNKNKKWNFRPPYLQVLPLLLLMFSSFSFFSKSHRSLKVCFTCSYMLIHKLLHLFLHSSSHEEVLITHILHVWNPQNTNRPPDSLGYVWPTKYVLTNFCIGVFSTNCVNICFSSVYPG